MTLDPETRNGYFISAEMKKIWAVEMELLKKLLEVCEKYNLRIFAEGGTLLGAVREHGFIPWDDDIDMAMLRDDYDKLQAIAKDEFKSPFFFQSGYTDEFSNGFTRIRMDGTAAILPQSVWHKCHQGIFIDLFPLDVVPDNEKELDRFVKEKIEKKERLTHYCNNYFSILNWKYNWYLFRIKLEIRKNGFYKIFGEYDRFIKQYWNTDNHRVSLISWLYSPVYLREKSWYFKQIKMPFEDIMIPVPYNYDYVLRRQFGDYMKPVKAPNMHGGFFIIDTNHSYKEYLHECRRKVRKDEWKKRWDNFKRFFID